MFKKIEKLKFPKERITSKTSQEEIPTVREIVEKINEIIEFISSEKNKKSKENMEYPFDLFKNGFEPEFTKNDMFKSFLFCSIGQAIGQAIEESKRFRPDETQRGIIKGIVYETSQKIIEEVEKQKNV